MILIFKISNFTTINICLNLSSRMIMRALNRMIKWLVLGSLLINLPIKTHHLANANPPEGTVISFKYLLKGYTSLCSLFDQLPNLRFASAAWRALEASKFLLKTCFAILSSLKPIVTPGRIAIHYRRGQEQSLNKAASNRWLLIVIMRV